MVVLPEDVMPVNSTITVIAHLNARLYLREPDKVFCIKIFKVCGKRRYIVANLSMLFASLMVIQGTNAVEHPRKKKGFRRVVGIYFPSFSSLQ